MGESVRFASLPVVGGAERGVKITGSHRLGLHAHGLKSTAVDPQRFEFEADGGALGVKS